jgi:malonate-semialdehyde dehydrogenase (acetylating)/methylmalonate-semialdehyde dehydrogenase
MHGFVCL